MSEGYSEEEALKKAIDEFGKDLPDMRDGEDLTQSGHHCNATPFLRYNVTCISDLDQMKTK